MHSSPSPLPFLLDNLTTLIQGSRITFSALRKLSNFSVLITLVIGLLFFITVSSPYSYVYYLHGLSAKIEAKIFQSKDA